MRQRTAIARAGSILLWLAASLALGDDGRHGRYTPFVGVFHPVIGSVVFDAERCPDESHPLLFSFTGSAQTTLGHALFTQSHCEDFAHSSFRRGVQTITFDGGDQLFGVYQSRLLATPTTPFEALIISGRYRNTGGSGALANARGRGISAGAVDTTTGAAMLGERDAVGGVNSSACEAMIDQSGIQPSRVA